MYKKFKQKQSNEKRNFKRNFKRVINFNFNIDNCLHRNTLTQFNKPLNFYIMRTNSKEVRNAMKNHILECVYDCSENTFPTLKEACNHLYNEFDRVANHANNIQRIPNEQKRFEDYLQGVPFHFHYTNEDIETFLNSLEINKEGKKYEPSQMWNLYAYLIFSETKKNK